MQDHIHLSFSFRLLRADLVQCFNILFQVISFIKLSSHFQWPHILVHIVTDARHIFHKSQQRIEKIVYMYYWILEYSLKKGGVLKIFITEWIQAETLLNSLYEPWLWSTKLSLNQASLHLRCLISFLNTFNLKLTDCQAG